MDFRESAGIALGALRANKLRSFLTLLGTIIGVTSVIAIISLVQGLNRYVTDKLLAAGRERVQVDKFGFILADDEFREALKRAGHHARRRRGDRRACRARPARVKAAGRARGRRALSGRAACAASPIKARAGDYAEVDRHGARSRAATSRRIDMTAPPHRVPCSATTAGEELFDGRPAIGHDGAGRRHEVHGRRRGREAKGKLLRPEPGPLRDRALTAVPEVPTERALAVDQRRRASTRRRFDAGAGGGARHPARAARTSRRASPTTSASSPPRRSWTCTATSRRRRSSSSIGVAGDLAASSAASSS